MLNRVIATVEKYGLLEKGDSVIVALSGGADSTALLSVFVSLKEKYNLSIYAAHINHNIRGDEAKRDENFCKILCKKFNTELFIKSVDVPTLAKQQKISEELCGRNVRYAFFDELSQKLCAHSHNRGGFGAKKEDGKFPSRPPACVSSCVHRDCL